RLVLAPVGEHHGDLPAAVPRGGDHVLVGDDVPVLAEHQTAAAGALLTGGHLDVDGAGQHVRGDRRYRLLGQVTTGGAARTGAHLRGGQLGGGVRTEQRRGEEHPEEQPGEQ